MIITLFLSFAIYAQSENNNNIEQETKAYIEQIRSSNPSSQKKLSLRTGLIQIKGNTEGITLNAGDDTMPFVAGEWTTRMGKHWGLEIRALHGQNILYEPANDKNEADVYFQTIDFGARYILEFDPIRKGNYFVFKLMYHQTSNNFQLSDSTNQRFFLATGYNGAAIGIERGVSITDKIHLKASLDIMYTLGVEEESLGSVKDNGYALFARGEFHYLVDWFGARGQVGLAYWQAAYTNEFDAETKSFTARQNFTTTYRVLSLSYSYLY
jgi:hypothetical protein